ncbi:C2H2 type zinc finger domain protein [Aspergillus heteromorphus CBS 117.55]|uniref:C2H2 type zinc finger domain protein n=1 Tax=Aspergillus heteromorphus CBS 117.55 TaxID=1448321 RepID=A0A317WZL0_9EURO|nr:C2H2 type zinc finger domain protein [Aspergillus heteromorphus CBS 117.55]PWY90707.1 C2H2 type zinc finger domain protein [Aspergillus heteromorphus CBS 117.55]
MKRHAAGHAHPRDGKRKRPPSYAKSGRVSQACKTCATSKLKCDEEKPCRRCRDKKLVCDWHGGLDEMTPESPGQGSSYDDPDGQPEYPDPEARVFSPPVPSLGNFPASVENPPQSATPDFQMNGYLPETQTAQDPVSASYDAISPMLDHESGIFSVDGTFFPEFIPDALIPSLSRPNELDPSNHTQDYLHNLFDHSMQFDFDLTEVDFGLIDYFNAQGTTHPAPQPEAQSDVDRGIALGAEAYKRSSLSAWKPAREDHAFADQDDLSVPVAIDSPRSSRSDRQILPERLASGSRDLIFGMVLQTSDKANLPRIMKSFPSTDLIDGLMQDYFAQQSRQLDSFIHGPTFRPNEQSADMLTAVAAAGAVRSAIPTIRKLGYALMEVARLHMSVQYESDNRITRDLRPSQTFALVIDMGIWSGDGRRTEIAESFQQPLVTMLRRALRFRRSIYSTIVPSLDDSDEALEKKWRAWVEQESFKRLVHHLFLHDAQSAVMLNVNPLISYAELELPLPSIRALWDAKSAAAWRDVYITLGLLGTERQPSLVDCMRDMSRLQGGVDTQLAGFVLLQGISAMVSEYHRFNFISKGSSKHWNALVTNSRHQELSQALQRFRMVGYEWSEPPRSEVFLVYEMISMLLHMSLEELQLFAGKEDKREARRVYHSALEWINSIDSRRAVWHAGQVIRAAKAMPAGSLTGFLAVGVYYASLVFWSYSMVLKARNAKSGNPRSSGRTPQSSPTVLLDGEETISVQKFICLGCGRPALQGSQEPAFLSDPGQTMDIAKGLLRADASQDALPPLVQGLCQLMGDLGNAAKSD